MDMDSDSNQQTSGVQQLIDRLHQEGIDKGRSDAETLIAAARKEAARILEDATRQAEALRKSASADAEQMKSKGEEAVQLAGRDAILSLTEELRASFEQTLKRFVRDSLEDPNFLRQLILQIAGAAVPPGNGSALKILLLGSESADSGAEASAGDHALNELARSLAGQSLRDGLTFDVADSDVPGVRVQVVDQKLEIDLTTDTLTHLLLKHLSPRIRAIVGE